MQQHIIHALDLDSLAKPTYGSVSSVSCSVRAKPLMQIVEPHSSIVKAERPALFPPVNGSVGIGSLVGLFSSNRRAIVGDRRRGASVHGSRGGWPIWCCWMSIRCTPSRCRRVVIVDGPMLDLAALGEMKSLPMKRGR